ncbi:DUF6443 domain-containing protein [Dyadobacter sp. LHD-138]|uniref:DUF6443 domain-containing protein n=1 Tax=Dyadobacter sp. LHD-138 TaxID=3071413 RepID=UPI0027E15581|nr:DUF6443 domain-containing protein [Dyadobacter sp. LHD-138]MDQ6482525.1 DUF6443 domain-containing protein [Dyadobacter sp. LHD-138]
MKRLIYLFLLLTVTVCQAQTTSRNFILSRTFKQTGAAVNNVSQVQIQVQYLDGLGRPLQTVGVGQSPSGKDLVVHQQYDAYGRAAKQFLPYATSTNGAFQASSLAAGFYTANSPSLESTDLGRPFTETTFERSPLNRPTAQLAPAIKAQVLPSATAPMAAQKLNGMTMRPMPISF